jgi:hypothetical protein
MLAFYCRGLVRISGHHAVGIIELRGYSETAAGVAGVLDGSVLRRKKGDVSAMILRESTEKSRERACAQER